MPRARTLLVLIVAVAAALLLWQRNGPRPDPHEPSRGSPNSAGPGAAPTATGADNRGVQPAPTGTDRRQTFATPAAPAATTSDATSAPVATTAPVRLDVRAPPSARAGERVTITIDAEAYSGVQSLAFDVSYDRQTLQFVSASPGSFIQQASAPAAFNAESSSEGVVQVRMDIKNGGVVAAAGTVVVLEFNVLRAGTSPITLSDVSYLQSGQSSGLATAVVKAVSIAIE